jgi:hypothetical protein
MQPDIPSTFTIVVLTEAIHANIKVSQPNEQQSKKKEKKKSNIPQQQLQQQRFQSKYSIQANEKFEQLYFQN